MSMRPPPVPYHHVAGRAVRAPARGALLAAAALVAAAGSLGAAAPESAARFDWVAYRGVDGGAVPPGAYRNPILAGFHSDPSVLRVGRDFYLVTSTFAWFPGIPVFHSRDLVHWRQIGNAIDRPGQLDFETIGMSRGVFAPAIAWHAGLFYIVNTCVGCGGNFVVTAKDPAGPWSDPVFLPDVEGIDPSLFFDDDRSAWIINNRGPVGTPRYDGHRALWVQRFDTKALKTVGEAVMVVDGGVDPATKPVWIEGPHILKKDGAYYIVAAEGGTGVNHSQVVLRAPRVTGPYAPAPKGVNPILTQRDLDPARADPVTSAGHADLVQLADGRWWAVFLATRPYAGDLYNLGRETFLLPVTWRGGWPVILDRGTPIPRTGAMPLPADGAGAPPTTGSFAWREDFAAGPLGLAWMSMRVPVAPWRVADGALWLEPRAGIGDHARPSFVARRLQHRDATIETAVRFAPAEGAEAGLAAVQNDDAFLTVAVTKRGGRTMVRVARRGGADDPARGVTIAEAPVAAGAVRLRMHLKDGTADFAYAARRGGWRRIGGVVDATNLSTAKAGGFVGTMVGPFAQGR